MKSTECKLGRVFVLKLEHGDRLPDCIEKFAMEKNISAAQVVFVGGIDSGKVVVGPRKTEEMPPQPVYLNLKDAYEALGAGIIAPNEGGKPILHMHATMGRGRKALTGCTRPGVFTWLTGEAVIYEIVGSITIRKKDPASGFVLLDIA